MCSYVFIFNQLPDPGMWTLPADALALIEPLGPSPDLVQALAVEAGARTAREDHRGAIEAANRAHALAAQLGLPEPAQALGFRGLARGYLGDPGGLADMHQALEAATAQGLSYDVAILYNNLAEETQLVEGPRQSLELARDGAHYDGNSSRCRGSKHRRCSGRAAACSPSASQTMPANGCARHQKSSPSSAPSQVSPTGSSPKPPPQAHNQELCAAALTNTYLDSRHPYSALYG